MRGILNFLLEAIVNYSWRLENVYVSCFPMTQDQCKWLRPVAPLFPVVQ